MNDPRLCPHCGYDFVKDAPIILNDFSMMNAAAPLRYKGAVVVVTPACRVVCWTLMKAFPRPVRLDVVLNRLGSEAEGNVVAVYLSRIRKALREVGAPIPFMSIRARGSEQPPAMVWVL